MSDLAMQSLKEAIGFLDENQKLEWESFVYRLKKKIKIHFKKIEGIFIPHKWEIYYVQLWKNISTELNKKRPCIVWSEKKYNAWWNLLILPSEINWLTRKSIITITDIKSVSKKRFSGKIWNIEEKNKQIIDEKLQAILWLKKPLNY
jgi:mRNA-degrading endonuclease toxin of MazEF toxin-antitoxin module